jgi:hypothetical protein
MTNKKNVSKPSDLKFKPLRRKFKKSGRKCGTLNIIILQAQGIRSSKEERVEIKKGAYGSR